MKPYFVFDLENIALAEGEYQIVECYANGVPKPKIHWEHNGLFFSKDEELRVVNFPAGTYTCVAENSEGRVETSFELKILKKLELLSGYNANNQTLQVKVGKSVEILCPFKNFDSIIWKRNGVLLEQKFSQLKIEKVKESPQDIYECTVSTGKEQRTYAYTIEVLSSPKIFNKNGKLIAADFEQKSFPAGTKLELKCETRGNPKPEVHWFKLQKVIGTGESLFIDNVQTKDIGKYECVAENSEGSAKIIFDVEVTAQPYVENGLTIISKKGYAGENFVLHCGIGGHPRPTIYWYKGA